MNHQSIPGRVVCIALFSAAALLSSAASLGAQSASRYYRGLAVDLAREAWRLQQSGDSEAALVLADRARMVDPRASDALYLFAELSWQRQEMTGLVLRSLQDAVRFNTFELFSPDLALRTLAAVYRRTGDHEALMGLFVRRSWDPAAAWRHEFVAAQLAGGGRWNGASLVTRLVREHPNDIGVARLMWERDTLLTVDFLQWIERALTEVTPDHPYAADVSAALSHAVRVAPRGSAVQAQLAEQYYRRGGADPLPALFVGGPDVPRWIGDGPPFLAADRATWDKLALETASRELVDQWINASTHSEIHVALDTGRDGFVSEHYHYRNGKLWVWRRDNDRNGVVDTAIEFDADGTPNRIGVATEQGLVRVEYLRYPNVVRVHWLRNGQWSSWDVADSVPFALHGLAFPAGNLSPAETFRSRVVVDDQSLQAFVRSTDRFAVLARTGIVDEGWERRWGFFPTQQ